MTQPLGLDDLNELFGQQVAPVVSKTAAGANANLTDLLSNIADVVPPPPAPVVKDALFRSASWLTAPDTQWGWVELRDYIVHESEQRFGPVPRNPAKEASIVKGFLSRWGDLAVPIARRAFDSYDGVWAGAPVRVERFSKGSDAYFAELIASEVTV